MKKYLLEWHHCNVIPEEIIHKLDRIMSKRPVLFSLKYSENVIDVTECSDSLDEVWVCLDKLIIRVIECSSRNLEFKQCDTSLFGYKLLTNYYGEDTEVIQYRANPSFLLSDGFFCEEDSIDSIKLKILMRVSESGWVRNS